MHQAVWLLVLIPVAVPLVNMLRRRTIYMDNAATTKVFEIVIQRMNYILRNYYGNPSSSYRLGKEAQAQLKEARCTESNNQILNHVLDKNKQHPISVVTSYLEHSSVINPVL